MTFLESKKLEKLSKVKRSILEALWGEGDSFPRDWVGSSILLAITKQKYFDRRIRELRDENGIDIETKHINAEHSYRLVSENLKSANPRLYLSNAEKRHLFKQDRDTCQVCGKIAQAGIRGLQADHKVPLSRGGSHDDNNWQSICNECNVAKRRSCQGCQVECLKCHWAFPESVGFPITLHLTRELFDKFEQLTKSNKDWLVNIIKHTPL